MIVLNRIDNRLIHGQVIEAWLPHLHIERVVVADDEAAADPLTASAMELAVPPEVQVSMRRVSQVDFKTLQADGIRTLVLFREVAGVLVARERGLPNGQLNIGNVHAGPGRHAVSRSVFLSELEEQQLHTLTHSGMTVVIQAVPNDRPVPLS